VLRGRWATGLKCEKSAHLLPTPTRRKGQLRAGMYMPLWRRWRRWRRAAC
jgi:hypothetical protein